MSFVLGGITFYEPGDHTLITNPASIQGVLAYNNNALYRLEKSALALSGHLHPGAFLTPGRITCSGQTAFYLAPQTNGYMVLRGNPSNNFPSIWLDGRDGRLLMYSGMTSNIAAVSQNGQWSFAGNNMINPAYGVTLPNSTSKGSVLAYAFVLWASDAKDKKDIAKIQSPKDILKKAEGITYTDTENKPRVGITAQDLEATGLPGAVDKSPEGDYIGINPMVLLYPLLEEVKALRAELDELKAKIK